MVRTILFTFSNSVQYFDFEEESYFLKAFQKNSFFTPNTLTDSSELLYTSFFLLVGTRGANDFEQPWEFKNLMTFLDFEKSAYFHRVLRISIFKSILLSDLFQFLLASLFWW